MKEVNFPDTRIIQKKESSTFEDFDPIPYDSAEDVTKKSTVFSAEKIFSLQKVCLQPPKFTTVY